MRWSARQGPPLVGAAVAVPDLQLSTVRGGEAGIVEAPARLHADKSAVRLRRPLLVGAAVAVPQLDQRAVGRRLPGHVRAFPVDLQRTVDDTPVLGRRTVAVPQLHLRTVGAAVAVVVDALAGDPGGDRPGGGTAAGTGRHGEVVELVGLVADHADADLSGGERGVAERTDGRAVDGCGDRAALELERQVVPAVQAERGGSGSRVGSRDVGDTSG